MGFSIHIGNPIMFDHATLPRRFVADFSKRLDQWVVFDAEDGHETPCENRAVATDYAALCEGARRLRLAKEDQLVNLWRSRNAARLQA